MACKNVCTLMLSNKSKSQNYMFIMIMTMHISALIHLRNLYTRYCTMYRRNKGEHTWYPALEKGHSKWKSCKQSERCCNSQNVFGGWKEH